MRFTRKPTQLPTVTGVFLSCFASEMTEFNVWGLVRLLRTISTSGMTWAGEKKCVPRMRSWAFVFGADHFQIDGRSVRGQDAIGPRGLFEFRKNALLELDFLDHGLDDHVELVEASVIGLRVQPGHHLLVLVLGELALLHARFEIPLNLPAPRRDQLGVDFLEHDVDARLQ